MIFKCKICGGSLDVKQNEKITVCEYCGVRQTIPNFIEPKTQEIYNRANAYLMHNEFDKAENLYNQILFNNKEDADAYWNVLMCRYGVTYVKDPATGKYIPTCNRTLYSPIFNDENYKNAIKYADEKQKELYIHNAKIIDDIQKGILAVSKKEKPFDIFISYKETDISGIRTKDSVVAQDLYEKLTAEGYKVFFSRITLEDKIGIEYEPYIYAALASSKVMITISSSKENIEAVWVKNEWSRFLSFAGKDSEKTLIPLYFNMGKEDLPDEFAHITSYDMKMEGFEQDLIRGIKKLIPLPVMLLERKKKFHKNLKIVLVVILILAIIGGVASIQFLTKKTKNIPASGETIAEEITNIEETSPEYQAAMQLYYDKNYPEATWAFEALGDYKDAKEMKEKCELSWRKSLATVAIQPHIGRVETGSYYINNNGEISYFSSDPGDAFKGITIDEHGKIISISGGFESVYALHEDGYVDNASVINEYDCEWNNVIKISPFFCSTNIALLSDGSFIRGDLVSHHLFSDYDDLWLKPIDDWKNIVDFKYDMNRNGSIVYDSAVVGLKSNGTLCAVYTNYHRPQEIVADEQIIKKFHDVIKFDIAIDSGYLNIYALTGNSTLQSYVKGVFSETDIDSCIDVYASGDNYYSLFENGDYIDNKNKKIIMKDVIHLQENFIVTRSGKIFEPYTTEKVSDEKTIVYDEWLERLK